jgi:ketosteroid isomerase-like protein
MTQRSAEEVRVVQEWHEALNAGDTERLVALSLPDVELSGPRGAVRGAEVLRGWVDRANISLDPLRFFHRGEKVVVEETAEWRSPETGEVVGNGTVGSVFVVRDGRVASVSRHDDLTAALDDAGLDGEHEVKLAQARP